MDPITTVPNLLFLFVYKDCHGGFWLLFSVFPIEEEKFYEYPVFPGMRWEEKIGAKGFY